MLANALVCATLPTTDLERAKRFYGDMLGLSEAELGVEGGVFYKAGGGTMFRVYTLRGADVPTGTLGAMRVSSPRTRVQRGYGWTSRGGLWVGYTLSQAVIDSHVVAVPSALKDELRGGDEVARYDFAAPNDNIGQLVTDGRNIWGLGRLLRRYAAEAGDALVVEFDLGARSAHALIGGQALLDPEHRPEHVVEDPAPEAATD